MLKTAPIVTPIIGEDRLSKDLQKAQASAKKFAAGVTKFGRGMTQFVSAPIAGAGLAAIKLSTDFNKSMSNIATLIPGQKDRVEELKKGIQGLSVESGKSTDDLSAGMYQVISAFGDTAESMDVLKTASEASVAGMATTEEAINLLSAVTKGYGDTTAEAVQNASDLSFLTVKLGQTTFPDLAASIGKVVPSAAALNISQKELFGTFATLTGVTGGAAEVATQMSSVLGDMLKPSEKLTKAVKKFGFESATAMAKQLGFRDSLRAIAVASVGFEKANKSARKFGHQSVQAMIKSLGFTGALDKLTESVGFSETGLAKMFGRKEALTAAFALLGGQSDVYKTKLDAMNKSLGATTTAYREVDSGINATGRSWEKTKARVITFAQRVGDKLIPVLTRLFDKIEPWLVKLEKMDDATLQWGLNIAKWAVMTGPAVLAIGKLSSGFLSLVTLSGQAGGFAGLTKGLGSIGSAAGGAVGKVGKLQRALGALGKVGLVGEAAAIGVGLGAAVGEAVILPQEKKKLERQETVEALTKRAQEVLWEGAPVQERQQLIKDLTEVQKDLRDTYQSMGADFLEMYATVARPFGAEIETTYDRYYQEWDRIQVSLEKLQKSITKQWEPERERKGWKIEKEPEKPKKPEFKIQFEADVPGKATISEAQTGKVMGGM